jgi:hypothetical protein
MKRLGRDQWLQLIAEFEGSGLTQKEFVAKHELSIATFQFHLYKSRKRSSIPNSESSAAFLPIEVVASPAPRARGAVTTVEVVLRSGVVIRCDIQTEPRQLAALIAALG